LWSLWKSSTMAFIAARVDGLGSVSHVVTTTFFCARAGPAPAKETVAAPAAAPPSRARNSRRLRSPALRSLTSPRSPGSLYQRAMVAPLRVAPGGGAGPDIVGSRAARPATVRGRGLGGTIAKRPSGHKPPRASRAARGHFHLTT